MAPYLVLHPMGFTVPPRLRLARWALTPPFHPCLDRSRGGLFSVALSVSHSRKWAARVYPGVGPGLRGIAPCGVRTFLPRQMPRAILRPSKVGRVYWMKEEV